MKRKIKKYLLAASLLLLCGQMVFSDSLPSPAKEAPEPILLAQQTSEAAPRGRAARRAARQQTSTPPASIAADSLPADSLDLSSSLFDSLALATDSLLAQPKSRDTTRAPKAFLDDVISGKNRDSLVYNLRERVVYIYQEGDVTYQNMNLTGDYMEVSLGDKTIFARGVADTAGVATRPVFREGSQTYTMDTIRYNLESKKAKIQGVATQEGEGYLIGDQVKKMPSNAINIAQGKYTTCDHTDHPHFYISLTKAKLTETKKVIFGPAYFVMEDVPIYFLGLPFGFFMTPQGRNSGVLMPEYGEEFTRGFFLRNGGYYFVFNDYLDLAVRGGIYTLGSWETSLQSSYRVRYKYNGGLNFKFSKDIFGEKGSADYVNMNNIHVTWQHTQDPKFRPNSTFSASVNFSTSGYSKYGATNLHDRLNTQTNSSISFSKTWPGKPFSFSTNLSLSQNSNNKTYTFGLPMNFNVSRIFPFKRREAMGKERWYEKISMQYTGNFANNVTSAEDDLFTEKMMKDLRSDVQHSIPISTSMNIFKYLNVSPSVNYTERWSFSKREQHYDPAQAKIVTDTTYGFYRVWNYNTSVSLSTKIYGDFTAKSKKFPVQAVRHVLTFNTGGSYTPDFGHPSYGYYLPVQADSTGRINYYTPYSNAPGRGKTASINFGIQNTLEAKVLSKSDTSGLRKIKIIDNLSANSSYNFLATQFKLSNISLNLRTANLFGNFGLNLSAQLDPYDIEYIDGRATRVDKLMWQRGRLGRIISTGWSGGYTFNSSKSPRPAVNDINRGGAAVANSNNPALQHLDPEARRLFMTSLYYDFNIPWNFGFNYSLNYSKPLDKATITQTLSYNGSVTLTEKWGVTFNGGYDFQAKKLTPGAFTVARDLHCWEMNFSWTPVGFYKSWQFTIRVKAAVLQDLKWEKRNSAFDNLYGY